MPESTDRTTRAKIAAHSSWAKTSDRSGRTAHARAAFLDRFDREVDPRGELEPAERARRAENARQAYFLRLALKSAQARRVRDADQGEPTSATTPVEARRPTLPPRFDAPGRDSLPTEAGSGSAIPASPEGVA